MQGELKKRFTCKNTNVFKNSSVPQQNSHAFVHVIIVICENVDTSMFPIINTFNVDNNNNNNNNDNPCF